MLGNGYKKIEIARVVGVDKSTITREIKRNADGRNGEKLSSAKNRLLYTPAQLAKAMGRTTQKTAAQK